MYVLFLWEGIFILSMVQFNTEDSSLIFSLDGIYKGKCGVLKSSMIIISGSIWNLCSFLFVLWSWEFQCLVHIYLHFLYLLDELFPSVICSSLYLIWLNFGLKCTLSERRLALLGFFFFFSVFIHLIDCFQIFDSWSLRVVTR